MTLAGVEFPVDTYREAAPHLRRPFTPAAVKFKVQATWPKDDPNGGLIVSYIDARLAIERLNLVCPHLWDDDYHAIGDGLMWCHLTVDGITRKDVGEGKGKGLVSDALKRAAVKFGIGVSLYAIPKMILNVRDGTVKQRTSGGKKTLEITPKGESLLRDMYSAWLETHGAEAFGEPLSHGDVDGAQGDHEAEPAEIPAGVDAQTGEIVPPVAKDVQRTGESDVPGGNPWFAEVQPLLKGIPSSGLKAAVVAAGGTVPERVSSWERVICALDAEGREAFVKALGELAGDPWAEDKHAEVSAEAEAQMDLAAARAEA